MSSLVAKGNTIHVPTHFLGGDQGQKVTVNWSQNLQSRNADYWICKYTVKSGGHGEGVIYVQANKLEEFKSKKTTGEDITIVVDDGFQYGQNKEQTSRFLVYHDKGNKPYQHRFIENTYTKLGDKAAEFIEIMGETNIRDVQELMKHFIGDYLKTF